VVVFRSLIRLKNQPELWNARVEVVAVVVVGRRRRRSSSSSVVVVVVAVVWRCGGEV
jgi:hypothetical protein